MKCPVCHTEVNTTHYYCFNCGANLRPAPPSTSIERQFMLYLGSFLLPPMGVWWGMKYLKQADQKSKIVGIVLILLTFFSIFLFAIALKSIGDTVNNQINSQLPSLVGY